MYYCGQIKEDEEWEFQGVFSTKEKAVIACKNNNYFIVPVELDKELPEDTVTPPNYEFPLK